MSDEVTLTLIVLGGRRGRSSRAELPSYPLTVRLSPEEKHRAVTAAKVNHQRISDFVRDAIVTAAEDCLEKDS